MSTIISIANVVPQYKHEQTEIANFMGEVYQLGFEEKRKLKLLYNRTKISCRYSIIPDFSLESTEHQFFKQNSSLTSFPNLDERMELFNKNAMNLGIEAVQKCIEGKAEKHQITHLITVSCTGLTAPGLDIELMSRLKLNASLNRTSVNFMGCYAAIHALKQADYICKSDPEAVVLIVVVELCTLHFQKNKTEDNIIANSLFADGAAATLVLSNEKARKQHLKGFEIKNFYSYVDLKGRNDMAWQLSTAGFLMTLSSYIPQLLQKGIKHFFDLALSNLDFNKEKISHWAIHPGGRKILEVVQKELNLDISALDSSYKILKEYGNMSSATFLFVLNDILETKVNFKKEELTFGIAFGPGLTMESVILGNA